MEISVWLPKGGCAKTLTSLSLAGYLASLGRRVLVVDLDPQSGALMWAKRAADSSQSGRSWPSRSASAMAHRKL